MSGTHVPWSVRFRRERQEVWTELEVLVTQIEREGVDGVRAEKLARLPVLYRATVSALGVARSSLLDQGLRDYLEALVARAYLVVYSPKRSIGEILRSFLLHGFAQQIRSIRWHVLVSALVMLIGGALAFALVQADMENYYLFISEEMAQGRDPDASYDELSSSLFHDGGDDGLMTFAAMLFTHNSTVGIMTYGLGCLFGLPVLLLLLYNGMILGAMTALFHDRGLAVEWWSWILPHGVTELTAIVFCGAAGLAIGQHVVFPGRDSRMAALAKIGVRMGSVVAGSVVMLLIAGGVEGVFRQVVHSLPVRYTMASVFAGLWIAYFVLVGRRRP